MKFTDDDVFCGNCGAKRKTLESPVVESTLAATSPAPEFKTKRNQKLIILISSCIVVACMLALVVFFLSGGNKGLDAMPTTPNPSGTSATNSGSITSVVELPQATEPPHASTNETTPATDSYRDLSVFLGQTIAEITEQFGNDYIVSTWGGGTFIQYKDAGYSFFYGANEPQWDPDETPEPTDRIFSVSTFASGRVILGTIVVGSTFSELEAYLNENLNIETSVIDDSYYVSFVRGPYRYILDLSDNQEIIKSGTVNYAGSAHGINKISGNADYLGLDLQTVFMQNPGVMNGPNGPYGQGTIWKDNVQRFYHLQNLERVDVYTNGTEGSQFIGIEDDRVVFFATAMDCRVGDILPSASLAVSPSTFHMPNGQNPSFEDTILVWQIDNGYIAISTITSGDNIAIQYVNGVIYVSDVKYLSYVSQ